MEVAHRLKKDAIFWKALLSWQRSICSWFLFFWWFLFCFFFFFFWRIQDFLHTGHHQCCNQALYSSLIETWAGKQVRAQTAPCGTPYVIVVWRCEFCSHDAVRQTVMCPERLRRCCRHGRMSGLCWTMLLWSLKRSMDLLVTGGGALTLHSRKRSHSLFHKPLPVSGNVFPP